MKIIKGLVYTDKQYIELLEKQRNCVAAKVDKAIKLLKEDYFEDGSGNNVEEVIKILKGEENESKNI